MKPYDIKTVKPTQCTYRGVQSVWTTCLAYDGHWMITRSAINISRRAEWRVKACQMRVNRLLTSCEQSGRGNRCSEIYRLWSVKKGVLRLDATPSSERFGTVAEAGDDVFDSLDSFVDFILGVQYAHAEANR